MKRTSNAYALNPNQKDVVVMMQGSALSSWLLFIFSLFSMTFTYLTYRQNKSQQVAASTFHLSKLNTQLQVKLHQVLDNYFNEQELRDLCFDMGVEYEDLPALGQDNKARELVASFARSGHLHTLEAEIAKQRPHIFQPVIQNPKPRRHLMA